MFLTITNGEYGWMRSIDTHWTMTFVYDILGTKREKMTRSFFRLLDGHLFYLKPLSSTTTLTYQCMGMVYRPSRNNRVCSRQKCYVSYGDHLILRLDNLDGYHEDYSLFFSVHVVGSTIYSVNQHTHTQLVYVLQHHWLNQCGLLVFGIWSRFLSWVWFDFHIWFII